jgi:mRNA interferase MazF
MPIFERGHVVRVPFPYVERHKQQYRPALVVSTRGIGPDDSLMWILMITSAVHEPWRGDVKVSGTIEMTGLPIPSVVRTAKIATIETASAELIGKLSPRNLARVMAELAENGF